jgi:hypothetical protein
MVKQQSPTVGVRFSTEDYRLAAALQKKLGVKALSEVVRMALRALATKEGVTA